MKSQFVQSASIAGFLVASACSRGTLPSESGSTTYDKGAVNTAPATKEISGQERYSGSSDIAAAAASAGAPKPTVRFQPLDLTTSVGTSSLAVIIDPGVPAVSPESLKLLGAQIALVTWPERQLVASQNSVVLPKATDNTAQNAGVALTPTAPLADRWYALVVSSVPDSFVMASDGVSAKKGAKGEYLSRFRVGSEPVLSAIREYSKDDGTTALWFDFSERLKAPTSPLETIVKLTRQDGATEQCSAGEWPEGQTANSFVFTCQRPVLKTLASVSLTTGLESNSGPAVSALASPILQNNIIARADGSRMIQVVLPGLDPGAN